MSLVRRAVLAATLILSACGGDPATGSGAPSTAPPPTVTASATESAAASGSTSPSEAPSATPEPADGLERDSLVEVVVTDLVVRSHAGLAAPSAILDGRLTSSDRAFVVDGPTASDGYEWYLVAPLDRPDGTRGPFGWIARASREGDAWVRAVSPSCPLLDGALPSPVDLRTLLALQPLERLACFGDDPLSIAAAFVSCGAGGGPWTFDPSWLVELGGCGVAADEGGEVLLVRVPPGGTGPSSGPVTVRGHFDDPAAATCTATSADPIAFPAPSADEAVLICRTQFVVEP